MAGRLEDKRLEIEAGSPHKKHCCMAIIIYIAAVQASRGRLDQGVLTRGAKGNEETDEMADKGIEKHSLRLKGDVQSRKTAENTSTPQGTPEAKESKRHKTKRTESAPERPSAAYVFCNVFQCQAADGG